VAHNRDLTVVAEGVETLQQLTFLHANRCDQVQGYYFSKAVPADIFTELLRDGGDFRSRLGLTGFALEILGTETP
jgi:EAL domain-containing protein (putative c-di-GMP-specific phosphodiesterase class I)